jgi:two-component system cell cycle response regulator
MRVAVVDPSRTVAKCLTQLLESHDHQVVPFRDGAEALDHIKSDQFIDVLITSSQLLSMSGPELCWQTRLLAAAGRPLYIVLMSSADDRDNLIKALDCGADDFIRKPPVAEELAARLRAANRVVSIQREMHRHATTDFLTGVLNRRAFFANAQELCVRANGGSVLSAVMLDIDHFKRINDTYGHGGGDDVLRALARELRKHNSTLVRLGGEEFAILLEGKAIAPAAEMADQMRLGLEELRIKSGNHTISLTCSFGVSQWESGDTIDRLLRRADAALYKAKTNGRNCVVSAATVLDEANYDSLGSVIRSDARDVQLPLIDETPTTFPEHKSCV